MVKSVREIDPVLNGRILLFAWKTTAPVQHRAELEPGNFFRCYVADFSLDHLADFLLKRETREYFFCLTFHFVLRVGYCRLQHACGQEQDNNSLHASI